MDWVVFWLLAYIVLIIWLTWRHVQPGSLEEYLLNNRNTKTLPLVFTTLATFVGGGTSMGLIAMGYESGFAAVGIGLAYVIGFLIISRFAAQIRNYGARKQIYSFPGYLNHVYAQNTSAVFRRGFSALISGVNIFIYFFLLAAQFVGMASLLKFSFAWGYQTAAIVSALVVILYTALAGLRGVIITDMIQFAVVVLMIIWVFVPGIWSDTEKLARLGELPDHYLDGTYYGWPFLIALPLFLSWSVLVRMDIWQRILAARDGKTAKKVSVFSGLGMLPFYIVFPLVGMAVRIAAESSMHPNDTVYYFLNRHSEGFLMGFMVVGLMAALMSSGDSFLNIISISAARDFLGWRRKMSDSAQAGLQKRIRIITVIFGMLALLLALGLPHIVDLMVVGMGTIVIFAPVSLFALLNDQAFKLKDWAMASILSGFIVNVVFFIIGTHDPAVFEPKSSFIPAFIVGSLVMLAGWLLKRNTLKPVS